MDIMGDFLSNRVGELWLIDVCHLYYNRCMKRILQARFYGYSFPVQEKNPLFKMKKPWYNKGVIG